MLNFKIKTKYAIEPISFKSNLQKTKNEYFQQMYNYEAINACF